MHREISFYFLTLMLSIFCICDVLPNLNSDEKFYEKVNKIIDSTRVIENRNEDKYGREKVEYTLVIVTTDRNEFYISKGDLSNWDSLNSVNMKGKRLEVLLRHTTDKTGNLNPNNVNIDGKTIVSIKENIKDRYIIIGLTISSFLYSFWLIKKRLKSDIVDI